MTILTKYEVLLDLAPNGPNGNIWLIGEPRLKGGMTLVPPWVSTLIFEAFSFTASNINFHLRKVPKLIFQISSKSAVQGYLRGKLK